MRIVSIFLEAVSVEQTKINGFSDSMSVSAALPDIFDEPVDGK